ncbi:hypothetical protein AEQ67_31240 [Pseudomonas sp. RIT-PI-q]|uniref:DUF4225 domain-containing protein n=1 Tax=Pseudomonas sp. RIT-PI-q TaxID=1690247 RepID=UPI0006CC788C|nr:DUF4225 domain-containing protein [Pseudomonas sp. RIT-PI-q]KPG90308.1 hypothetical protein AEQ67_31240 [Pseudomonas sp. RIT-PI-q]
MNETSCDIHDVTKAASDLVAVGCNIGMTHFTDGIARLRFSSIISVYANEVIQAVDEGLISAWQGLQELRVEHEALLSKALFYTQNGIGVLAGGMQIEVGIAVTGASWGIGAVPGALLIGHGANNIAEGMANIYNGPAAPSTQGPIRRGYQALFRDSYNGNMAYYSTDLLLSGYGMFRTVRKPGSLQFFRYDPISNERAYQQSGTLALLFEGLVDSITLNSMIKGEQSMVRSD